MHAALAAFILTTNAIAQIAPATPNPAPPAALPGLSYDAPFFPGADHDPAIPTPDSVLGYRVGDKPATHAQIEAYCKALAAASPRVKLFEYAKSHEGRTLYYLAFGSEANINRLDAIKADAATLADPRGKPQAALDRLAANLPAIAWMAYTIHGDEMTGADAALALMHHLAAGRGKDVTDLLNNVIVLVDPLMNPDGRDRCVTGIQQARTAQPNVDDQAVIHTQAWPGGRTNHYLFDMNRDWIFATQPESRGRIAAAGAWNPHYFMESHEMGSQDTFLFMPPRQPINKNIPDSIHTWGEAFAADQAAALDAHSWRYYTGEWNEEWYPGYSGSWAALRGAIDNLYEQASIQTDAIRRHDGTLEPYREGVHKQLVSSWANLTTLSKNRTAVVKDFAASRRRACGLSDAAPARLFVPLVPPGNAARWQRFADQMEIQGIEIYSTAAAFTAPGRDWLGRTFEAREFPAGTLVIPSRQPLGDLATALLQLDPRMSDAFLTEERRELLRFGRSRLYDITAWNLALLNGIELVEVQADLPAAVTPHRTLTPRQPAPNTTSPVGVAFDGEDDRATFLAARLLDAGVKVRVLDKPTTLAGHAFARGSLFISTRDNVNFKGDLAATIAEAALTFGLSPIPLTTGLGLGDNPDFGGEHFALLETPRIALLSREPFSGYSTGEAWHLLDHDAGLRISLIDASQLRGSDLRRYNVIIIPDGGTRGWDSAVPDLRTWVESGGTLIAIGNAASAFAKEGGIGSTRLLPDVITKLDGFRAAIIRDHLGKSFAADPAAVWSNTPPAALEYPWTMSDGTKPSDDEAKRRDEWRSVFMPQGALLAARTDDRSFLTFGCGQILPVVVGDGPILIPKHGGHAPLLLGTFVNAPPPPPETPKPAPTTPDTAKPADAAKPADGTKHDTKPAEGDKATEPKKPSPGWTLAPPGMELRLRMSGLLWPEAADRLAHAAYTTQERVGNGQIILFAQSPNFRAATRGPARVLLNAAIFGPGMGASHPIRP